MEWLNLILAILSSLIVILPLVCKLIETVQKYVKEKNWSILMQLLLDYMAKAEQMYESGAERKEYVMSAIITSAEFSNFNVDADVVSKMIDDICAASKKINIKSSDTEATPA